MTASPFDIRSVLLAKHAQHVVLIHFPIALFLAGVAFDFLARWTNKNHFAVVAYHNLIAAGLTTVPVLITGILAWQWQLEGHKLKGILLLHLVLGCTSSLLIWVVALIHVNVHRKPGTSLPGFRLPIEAVAVALVIVTAHLGGFLSGVNGAG